MISRMVHVSFTREAHYNYVIFMQQCLVPALHTKLYIYQKLPLNESKLLCGSYVYM